MTKAGCHPSRIDFLTLRGPRLVMGVRLQPMAVAFSLELKGVDLPVGSDWKVNSTTSSWKQGAESYQVRGLLCQGPVLCEGERINGF